MEMEKEYASKGVAGAGLGLGIAGTALWLLQNGGGFGGLFGNGQAALAAGTATSAALAEKDAQIARLQSEKYSDNKVQELFSFYYAEQEKRNIELVRTRERLTALELQVANQQQALGQITTIRVPNTVLCPGVPSTTISFASSSSDSTTSSSS